jgi:hypothetical protein
LCASAAEKRDYEALLLRCQHLQLFSFYSILSNVSNRCNLFTATRSFRSFYFSAPVPSFASLSIPALQREANYSKPLPCFASVWRKLFGSFPERQTRGALRAPLFFLVLVLGHYRWASRIIYLRRWALACAGATVWGPSIWILFRCATEIHPRRCLSAALLASCFNSVCAKQALRHTGIASCMRGNFSSYTGATYIYDGAAIYEASPYIATGEKLFILKHRRTLLQKGLHTFFLIFGTKASLKQATLILYAF